MSKYYIFGSENFDTVSIDIDLSNNMVKLEAGKDYLTKEFFTYYKLDKFKKELQDFLNHIEQLEKWSKK